MPDDVVVNIFDKLSDIKWLCRCLVVSKRFFSLIPLIQTVSIKTNAGDCLSLSGNVCDLEFFAKLTQIRSLNLDLVSDFDADKDSVFKWGANFTSDLDSLTFLYAASLSERMESEDEDEEEEDDETENKVTQEETFRRLYLAMDCVKEGLLWLLFLSRGIRNFFFFFDRPRGIRNYPMLQSITITDSTNKGVRLYLGGEKLVDCRNAFKNAIKCPEEAVPRQESVRVGSVSVLQLPTSGYVMKGVIIVHVKLCRGDDSESDAQLAMVDAFAEERGRESQPGHWKKL
ncbi:hypothetical protein RHMOL_Rhmol13G0283400 [Rhododendron molle]|uniref:Uncharacterized protein n=1 Tax=Rhododendron molle TaxID=49168 RepID=A0ACC0LD89_RHOML|nr:hypothetical protein RHMOL_Rhmol13G0283400 [Rhododendron molle]